MKRDELATAGDIKRGVFVGESDLTNRLIVA
jgi:hypothetical protein